MKKQTAKKPDQLELEHRKAANKAVFISALGLGLTGVVELLIAIFTGSVALLGDAIHNLADVSTSVVIFLGFYISKRKPTKNYPYGYERAEDIAGLGVALAIWLSAAFAGYQSYQKLIVNSGTTHLYIGMAAAVLGMGGNFVVSRYKLQVAKQIHSSTMEAEANHSWLDVVSSFGALIGLIGVALGFKWADPIAGLAVTVFILHIGYEVTRDIFHHLMDGVEPEHIDTAQKAISRIAGLSSPFVKGRWLGRSLIIEVEAEFAGNITVLQTAKIGKEIEAAILSSSEEVKQVHFIPKYKV